jgi:DNA modification methylase
MTSDAPFTVAMAKRIELWPIDRLVPYDKNSRLHSPEQIAQVAASISEFGFTNPILVDSNDGIVAGHGRLSAARELGMEQVPVVVLDHLSERQKRAYVIADNKLALNASWDDRVLASELVELREDDFDLSLIGFSDDELADLLSDMELGGDGTAGADEPGHAKLSDKFGVPPFSVLNAREGWWQDRKRGWLELGIKSELGREGLADTSATPMEYFNGGKTIADQGGSVFDPVLCEIAYRWFSPVGGIVLDPFAGGSVRGIVAAQLGRQYIGHELRPEQVEANREQAAVICADAEAPPVWIEGDSRNIDRTCKDVDADFVFSCPPYADLEVYSDNPADLSTLGYAEFREAYFEIIAKACARLKEDRFACFVVGDVWDKKGNYYNFVGDTVDAFRAAGLHYYNEAILVTAVGSLPIRSGKIFTTSRKLGKTHQNVLVFVKGDGKRAATNCGECQFGELEPAEDLGEVLE